MLNTLEHIILDKLVDDKVLTAASSDSEVSPGAIAVVGMIAVASLAGRVFKNFIGKNTKLKS